MLANRSDVGFRMVLKKAVEEKMEQKIIHGDSLQILRSIESDSVDLIIADPPYFLSNGGITCYSGKMVKVDKGDWDKSSGIENDLNFNTIWLTEAKRVLKDTGSLFVSGTRHNIFMIGYLLQKLGFIVLNEIVWEKPNPPPNLSCRYFTHSTEIIIWAAKTKKYKFNYELLKQMNGGKQMKNVWRIPPPSRKEKLIGKHPTQKPLELIKRIILAASDQGDVVLDPFLGSGTTLVACQELGRIGIGVEMDEKYVELAKKRIEKEK